MGEGYRRLPWKLSHYEFLWFHSNFMWLTYPIIRWEHGLEGNTVQWHRWITQSQPAWTARGPSSWMYWKTTNHTKIYSRVKKLSCFHKVQEKQKFQKINPSCSVDWTMHWKVCRVDWMAEQCYLINFVENSQISHNWMA